MSPDHGRRARSAAGWKISQPPPESMQGISSTSRRKARSAASSSVKIITWAPLIMLLLLLQKVSRRAAGGGRSRAPCRVRRPSAAAISAPSSESPIADQHEPQRGLVHRPVLMAVAQLVDQLVDRVEHRIERVAIAARGSSRRRARRRPPGRRRRRCGRRSRSDRPRGRGRARTASSMPAQTRSLIIPASAACSPAAEPKWWSRLAWVLPISAATAFSVTACGPLVDQQACAPPRARRRGFPRG